MPVIHTKECITILKDENSYPEQTALHSLECDCTNCGNRWRLPLLPENISYQNEARMWQERYLHLETHLQELMRFSELHYSMNPMKDMLIKAFKELHDKFNKGGDEYNPN